MTRDEFESLQVGDIVERYDGMRRVVIESPENGFIVVGCVDIGVVHLTESMCAAYKVRSRVITREHIQ